METSVSSPQLVRFTLFNRGQLPANTTMETSVSSLHQARFTLSNRAHFFASATMATSVILEGFQ